VPSLTHLKDTYGLTKQLGEVTARSFARRFANAYEDGEGVDIYAFRIGNVVEPHEYAQNFKKYLMEVDSRKRNAWSYIDARDLGKMCHLASQSSGLGFQVRLTSPRQSLAGGVMFSYSMRPMTPPPPSFPLGHFSPSSPQTPQSPPQTSANGRRLCRTARCRSFWDSRIRPSGRGGPSWRRRVGI